ncbi:hypothetical protein L484_010048 [Morus notabilis]|uniref:Uncharacterized protein n=1 Tax=Morus notabilis TaxID=981085 RepID=W9RKP1_9ROSA|nr:hypothetical protein L484_010048 [Morus notabilis]
MDQADIPTAGPACLPSLETINRGPRKFMIELPLLIVIWLMEFLVPHLIGDIATRSPYRVRTGSICPMEDGLRRAQ